MPTTRVDRKAPQYYCVVDGLWRSQYDYNLVPVIPSCRRHSERCMRQDLISCQSCLWWEGDPRCLTTCGFIKEEDRRTGDQLTRNWHTAFLTTRNRASTYMMHVHKWTPTAYSSDQWTHLILRYANLWYQVYPIHVMSRASWTSLLPSSSPVVNEVVQNITPFRTL